MDQDFVLAVRWAQGTPVANIGPVGVLLVLMFFYNILTSIYLDSFPVCYF